MNKKKKKKKKKNTYRDVTVCRMTEKKRQKEELNHINTYLGLVGIWRTEKQKKNYNKENRNINSDAVGNSIE